MGSHAIVRRGRVRTKFTAVDAARVALAADHPTPLPSAQEARRLRATALMWSRDLQFPTVRDIGVVLGLTSTSSITEGFGRLIDLHAAVISHELEEITRCWDMPVERRVDALVGHAANLTVIGSPCLRLPGLVWSAATMADPTLSLEYPGLGLPLQVLAAFAEPARSRAGSTSLRRMLSSVVEAEAVHANLAVPA